MKREYRCCECGLVVNERWMRKMAMQLGYVLEYSSPCPICGCPEWEFIPKI